MGGVGNGAAEDLNPEVAALMGITTRLGQRLGPLGFGVRSLPCGLGSRRDFAWKKRGERTVAGGP